MRSFSSSTVFELFAEKRGKRCENEERRSSRQKQEGDVKTKNNKKELKLSQV